MKKIFFIVACCLCFLIVSLLIATNFIFVEDKVVAKTPNTINVYNKSNTALNNESLTSESKYFSELVKQVSKVGKVSVFERLINGKNLDGKITQMTNKNDVSLIADVRMTHICVEFIYETVQDKVVYIDGNSKVISYNKLTFAFSSNKVDDIKIYYSEGSKGYDSFLPLVMCGKAKNVIEVINKMW